MNGCFLLEPLLLHFEMEVCKKDNKATIVSSKSLNLNKFFNVLTQMRDDEAKMLHMKMALRQSTVLNAIFFGETMCEGDRG